MKRILLATLSVVALNTTAQDKVMTKELLWQLGRKIRWELQKKVIF